MELPITIDTAILINQFYSIFVIVGFATLAIEQALKALMSAKNV